VKKKPKLLLAVLILLMGAASAAGRGLHASMPGVSSPHGESAMLHSMKGGS